MYAEKISGGLRILDWKIPYFLDSIGPKARDWIREKFAVNRLGWHL